MPCQLKIVTKTSENTVKKKHSSLWPPCYNICWRNFAFTLPPLALLTYSDIIYVYLIKPFRKPWPGRRQNTWKRSRLGKKERKKESKVDEDAVFRRAQTETGTRTAFAPESFFFYVVKDFRIKYHTEEEKRNRSDTFRSECIQYKSKRCVWRESAFLSTYND